MNRPALTKADWKAFGQAAERWADNSGGAEFRAAVEGIIQRRLAKAWSQGFTRGWDEGVKDATSDEGGNRTPPNPYEGRTGE